MNFSRFKWLLPFIVGNVAHFGALEFGKWHIVHRYGNCRREEIRQNKDLECPKELRSENASWWEKTLSFELGLWEKELEN